MIEIWGNASIPGNNSNPKPPVSNEILAAGFTIVDGKISNIDVVSRIETAFFEDGWLFVGFASPQNPPDYLIFASTDLPVKIQQYKYVDSFELVFTDPNTGESVNPGLINIQIIKVK